MEAGTPSTIITSEAIVTPSGVVNGWLEARDGMFVTVASGAPPRRSDYDVGDCWIVPGFVDIHCHGGGGASFPGGSPEGVETAARAHRLRGTTSLVASLMSADEKALTRDIHMLREHVADATLLGIHLEGPWIAESRRGAHERQFLAEGTAMARRLLAAGAGDIRMVTVAPDVTGGLDLIREVVEVGAVAAVGHTDATYAQTLEAIEAGATAATHLFNGMRPVDHREPGPIVALMNDERVHVELILDGVHVHAGVVATVKEAVGAGRVLAVTDAMAAAGAGDGWYTVGQLRVRVTDGVARSGHDSGVLAGSTLTMDRAFAYAVREVGFSVTDAVKATSTNPARALGLERRLGSIAPGLAADLVVLDPDCELRAVMTQGMWVKPPEVELSSQVVR